MNILQICSSSRISGAEKHVVVLSERLRQRGHTVHAICPPGGWLPDQLRAAGIPALEMDMRGLLGSCSAPRNLTRYVRDNGFDLIHAHLTRATYVGILAGRWANVPLVSSIHCRTTDVVYRYLFPPNRGRIVTVSDFLKNGLMRKGVPAGRIRTIYNGTDFVSSAEGAAEAEALNALPVRAELSLPPDAELVGIFARVEEFKGHFVLAQAVKQLVAARPRAYVVCVGTAEPETQKQLWDITAADGVAERLRFTGQREDVHRLMSAMDVLTLPSRYEACSMAIIEGMALGKPVVATRAGGNPELVEHEATGLLIERNPEGLANALIQILSDPIRMREMGQEARRRAEMRFSADVMVNQIEGLYGEMLGQA